MYEWQPFQSNPDAVLSGSTFRISLFKVQGVVRVAVRLDAGCPASNWPRLYYFGAVAQLGERLICIQEVAGSIPTSSTSCQFFGPVAQVARAHP